jgi:hypothetical protein
MSETWNTKDMVEALPSTESATGATAAPPEVTHDAKAHWGVEKTAYDYATYNLSSKEQYDKIAAAGVGAAGDWASNAKKVSFCSDLCRY